MTVPMATTIISFALWLIFENMAESRSGHPISWAIDVCRIVFAASVLVVLYGLVNTSIFK